MKTICIFASGAIAATLVLTACSGGSRPYLPDVSLGQNVTSAGTATVTVKITVATKSAAFESGILRPHYFSRSSKGLLVRVYPHRKRKLVAELAIDISSGSKACGGKKGYPRTCSATLSLPPGGSDDFRLYDYSRKPKHGKIPHGAKLLGYGERYDQKISATKRNEFAVYLKGVIAGLSAGSSFVSFPADGDAHTLSLVIDPTDFGNNPITAGKKDPFANPISVSIIEIGGSGHTALSLDGGAPTTKVQLRYSTDTTSLSYDGGGAAGYGVTLFVRAPKLKKTGGASTHVQVSPLFVTATLLAGTTLSLSPGAQPKLEISELDAPSGQNYAVQAASDCASIASVGTVTGGGANANAFVTGGNALSSSGCTIEVSDGSAAIDLRAVNAPASSSATAPATVTISEFPIPSGSPYPYGIAAGPDGAMWFTEKGPIGRVGRIPTDATPSSGAQISEFPTPVAIAAAAGITSGPDGALWFAECDAGKIARIPTDATPGSSAQITQYATSPNHGPIGLVFAQNGTLWYGDDIKNSVTNMSTAGVNGTSKTTTQNDTTSLLVGPDGATWFTECAHPSYLGRVDASGHLTETAITTTLANNPAPAGIAVGSDGNLWFTDFSANYAIGKAVVHNGAIVSFAEIPLPAGANPRGIVAGPDGALWFADFGNSAIGRIPTNATSTADIKEYALPPSTGDGPLTIVEGPDGALWFTEFFTGKIGRLKI